MFALNYFDWRGMPQLFEGEPRCVWNPAAELGEGPVWVPREKAVYFVDILGCSIHRWQENGRTESWRAPSEPGFLFRCKGGGFICGLRGGLHHFDPDEGTFTLIVPVEQDKPRHRLNDGFADPSGRLWFGSMHEDTRSVGGALYSFDRDYGLRLRDSHYTVTNGPAISPDGGVLYHVDSAARVVYSFTLSVDGSLSNKRRFLEFPCDTYPDGLAVDAAGNLWIALFNGWRLEYYSPEGRKLGTIRFPCAQVTKPAFGGTSLQTLYVTTARTGFSPDAREQQPHAGGLFAVGVPVPGLPSCEVDWGQLRS